MLNLDLSTKYLSLQIGTKIQKNFLISQGKSLNLEIREEFFMEY